MGWKQVIEYVDAEVTLPPPVKKQVWNGEKFVPITLYKHMGLPNGEKMAWLQQTYGRPGVYESGRFWDYSRGGNYIVMDEQVYMWFQMKWTKSK